MASKVDSLKTLVSSAGLARSYNWQFVIPILPAKLVTNLSAIQGLADFSGTNLDLFCKECPLPPKAVEQIEVMIKMQTWVVNGKPTNHGTIAPVFVMDGEWDIYKVFRTWADLAASNKDDKQLNESDLQTTGFLKALNGNGETKLTIEISDMWCPECPEITFNSDSAIIEDFSPVLAFSNTHIVDSIDGISTGV